MNASDDRVKELLVECRGAGLRRTECLRAILKCFVEESTPVSVQQLLRRDELRGKCDPATVYRLLARLETRSIIRRVGLPRRAAHYVLNQDQGSRMYAVDTESGDVLVVTPKWDEAEVLRQVKAQAGFDVEYFEIQFYGAKPGSSAATPYAQADEPLRQVAEE